MDKLRLGIDLGTTNTVVCHMKNSKPKIIKMPGGMLKSVLYVEDDSNTICIGQTAAEKMKLDPLNGISSSKTHLGSAKTWEIRNKKFTPTDVATEILKEVKRVTIKKLKLDENNTEIEAIITVPAYFNANQSDETKTAGENAGIKVLSVRPEPSAAAIANIRENDIDDEKIFIVDLGGGTFDVCVIKSSETNGHETLAVSGDRKLGGDDFDDRIFEFIKSYVEDDLGMDLSTQEDSELSYSDYYRMIGELKDASVTAKTELTESDKYEIDISNLFPYRDGYYSLSLTITQDKFHQLCDDLFKRVIEKIEDIFTQNKNKFTKDDIDKIILAGGSCYIPRIKKDVENFFGKSTEGENINRSEMVAIGACFIAESWDDLSDKVSNDIISHSLGIQVLEGGNLCLSKLLLAGENYPCSYEKKFTTSRDNQTEVDIEVYEAGSDLEHIKEIKNSSGQYNHDFYGSFILDGIAPAPKGEPRITVTFDYDKSRSLTVTALDEKTGISKKVKIDKNATRTPTRGPVEEVNFAVLIDTSGSMQDGFNNREEKPLTEAKTATIALIKDIIDLDTHKMTIIGFGDNAYKTCDLTNSKEELIASVDSLRATGGTNMYDAICEGVNELKNSSAKKVIIMITDGEPNNTKKTLKARDYAKKNDVDIIAIGVGSYAKKDFLLDLTGKNDFVFSIENMNELTAIFEKVVSMYLASI